MEGLPGLRRADGLGKAASQLKESPVLGIAAIAVFIVVIAALNFIEFGRFD